MREIKFRGKRVSTGEWVYGTGIVPVQQNTYETGEYEIVREVNYDELDYYHSSYDTYNVIPETIGQYTGMKDKKGREIYEGDIVKSGNMTGIVEFNTEDMGSCGCCWPEFFGVGFVIRVEGSKEYFFGAIEIDECEVVGNIYER